MLNLAQVAFLPFLTALAVTTILTFFSIPLAKKLGLIDDPKVHKHPGMIHTIPIPRGGGLPLYFGTLLTSIIFIPISPIFLSIFFGTFLVMAIGLIDDKLNAQSKDVSPYLRTVFQIIAAIIV